MMITLSKIADAELVDFEIVVEDNNTARFYRVLEFQVDENNQQIILRIDTGD